MNLSMNLTLGILQPLYDYTDDVNIANQWLSELTETTAFDFEVASMYNKTNRKEAVKSLSSIDEYKIAYTTGLSYPSMTKLTHLGFSNKEDYGRVIILKDDEITKVVLDYLVNTDIKQIWHNATFDFRHILYYTNKLPKNYEDTRLIVKSKKNNVDQFLGSTSLKLLMKKYYGEWEKERVDFEIENMYDNTLIKYTAIDVCATYKLYKILSC